MSFFEDILDSSTTVGKVAYAITFAFLGWFLITAAVAGTLLYSLVKPEVRGADLRDSDLFSKPELITVQAAGGKPRDGWFFPGLTTSPTIILCHGYQGHKGDIITMVSSLQKDRFNVFVFDFSGHGRAPGATTLGPGETKELLAAIDVILKRTDVDQTRVGVWGFDMGAYAALSAALADPRVKAVAADSVYDQPRTFFELLARRADISKVPLSVTFARWGYSMMNWGARNDPPLSQRVAALRETSKLFVQGQDNPALAESTLQLFLRSPEPRKQAVFPKSNYATMIEEERKAYETEVVHFFLAALPPAISQ